MAAIDGKWSIEFVTLAGSRRLDLTVATAGAALTGTAVGDTGPIPLRDGRVSGDVLEFVIDYVAPLPMSLAFQLRVIGDRLVGTAQAGPYPPSQVIGRRAV